MTTHWLDSIKFNEDGLLPAIAQDKDTGEVLMVAWMNREALELTATTQTGVYFSRSRNKLWHKGESSGHKQIVHDLFLDCDNDVILLQITQVGGIACHTGRQSCFYQKLDLSQDTPEWQAVTPVLKDPSDIYSKNNTLSDTATIDPSVTPSGSHSNSENVDSSAILQQLDKILIERKSADPNSSYVASLYAKGLNKILEKVGEEAVETIIAAKDIPLDNPTATGHSDNKKALTDDLVYEIADVWFHTMVTLAWFNIPSQKILTELSRRFGLSGIAEKNARSAN